MQPTMKLRILRKPMYSPSPTSTGHAPPVYKDTWQQWWEGPIMEESGPYIINTHVYRGEWRDVEIVTE